VTVIGSDIEDPGFSIAKTLANAVTGSNIKLFGWTMVKKIEHLFHISGT
jgi:hypothetical protein